MPQAMSKMFWPRFPAFLAALVLAALPCLNTAQAVSAPANAAHWEPFPVGEMGIGQQTLLVHQIDSRHMAVMLGMSDDEKAEAWVIKKVQTLLPNEGLLYVLDQDDKDAMKREDSLDAPRLDLCIPRIPLYSLRPELEGFAYSAAFLDEV